MMEQLSLMLCLKPGPPRCPMLGYLPVAKELMESLPKDTYPHHIAIWLGAQYDLDRVFNFDVWPMAD